MKRRVGVVLVLLAAACGCKVGTKYRTPQVPQVPQTFKELAPTDGQTWQTAKPNDSELRGNWWELFNDPKLNELEQAVSISNQSVKQAEAQFRQARALVALNHANYYPTISASPSITSSQASGRARSSVTGGVARNTGALGSYSLPISASWEPDLWGRVALGVQNASASAQASAAQLENLRLSLQAEVASDYFLLHGSDMEMNVLNRTIEAYERALQLTVNRFNGGVASKADVEQARTQLDNARASATDLQIMRAQYEHALAMLTGRAPADLSVEHAEIHGGPPPIPVAVPSTLLERRPDIAGAERQVAAANANIGLAKAAYYPSLVLSATGGVNSSSFLNWLTWPSRYWSLGPTLAQTLLDFGRRRATTLETEAAYDATVASYRQTALTAFQEVEDSLAALHYLAQEATEQQAAVTSAEASLTLELDRYKAGTVSYLDVITTQTIALTSERAAVQILERRMTNSVNLVRALGGGWNVSSLPSTSDMLSATHK